MIAVAVPVRRNGKDMYGLSAGMSPEPFESLLRQQQLPQYWIPAITDSSGVIVARARDTQMFVGRRASQHMLDALARADSDEGFFHGTTLDGVETHAAFKRSPVTGWTVVIGIRAATLESELRQALAGLALAIAALFALSLLAVRLLGRRIAGSIRALTAPAIALGEGKTVTVPPLYLAEADEVGKALMRASDMLEHARYEATHDTLTGLANRALFHEIVDQQVALAARNAGRLSVLYIDLDGFKAVNDDHGHAAGDRLLRHVSDQLRLCLRKSDVAARLGGDEFAAVLVGASAENASAVAEKILDNLMPPYMQDGVALRVSASIGIASYPRDGGNTKELLHAADDAMYRAKAAGKNQAAVASLVS